MSADVLAVDPVELRRTAATLRTVSGELGLASSTLDGAVDAELWSGLAALEQAARRAESAALLRALGRPLEAVAAGLDRAAASAEDAGGRVRRHERTLLDLEDERWRLAAPGPPTDPLAIQAWQSRLTLLEEERDRVARMVDRARAEFDEAQRAVAVFVERELGSEVFAVVGTLALLVETVRTSARGWHAARTTVSMVTALHRVRRMPVPGGERTLHLVSQRVGRAAETLSRRPPGWAVRLPAVGRHLGALAARGAPVMVLVDAVPRVIDGGGHTGLRGGTTRVLAGAAVVGVVVAATVSGTAVAPVALVSAGVYTVWRTGGWVYDHRQQVRSTVVGAWSGARGAAGSVAERGRALGEQAARRARRGLDDLRGRWSRPSGAGTSPAPVATAGAP